MDVPARTHVFHFTFYHRVEQKAQQLTVYATPTILTVQVPVMDYNNLISLDWLGMCLLHVMMVQFGAVLQYVQLTAPVHALHYQVIVALKGLYLHLVDAQILEIMDVMVVVLRAKQVPCLITPFLTILQMNVWEDQS